MAKTKISVTQDHINKGRQGDVSHCPVALALKSEFPGKDINVASRIYVDETYIPTPSDVWEKIKIFDLTGRMEPFEFSLNVPYQISG